MINLKNSSRFDKNMYFYLASSKPDPLEVGDIFRLNQDISSSSEINTRRSTLNLPKVIQWFLQTSKKSFVYF